MSGAQQIFSEIEFFLDSGRFDDAKILLGFLDPEPADRESQLYLLLINTKLDGPARHKREIDRLTGLPSPTELEKQIIQKILELQSNATELKRESTNDASQLLDPASGELKSDLGENVTDLRSEPAPLAERSFRPLTKENRPSSEEIELRPRE